MSEPFLGEIRLFGFDFAPSGYALCSGQTLPLQQNAALFSLLGTQFGGNGVQTFNLPDLRGRVPAGVGTGLAGWNPTMGEKVGVERVTLVASELPSHMHFMNVAATATTGAPGNTVMLASSAASKPYRSGAGGLVALDPASVKVAGSSESHSNLQPYLAINFAIALQGIYPSRN